MNKEYPIYNLTKTVDDVGVVPAGYTYWYISGSTSGDTIFVKTETDTRFLVTYAMFSSHTHNIEESIAIDGSAMLNYMNGPVNYSYYFGSGLCMKLMNFDGITTEYADFSTKYPTNWSTSSYNIMVKWKLHPCYNTGTTINSVTGTTIVKSGHTFVENDVVMFNNSGGTYPNPISGNTLYYIVNSGTNSFEIATTSGGSAIETTDSGTGILYVDGTKVTFGIKSYFLCNTGSSNNYSSVTYINDSGLSWNYFKNTALTTIVPDNLNTDVTYKTLYIQIYKDNTAVYDNIVGSVDLSEIRLYKI